MSAYPEVVVLLPVHRPGPHLRELVADLLADGACRIVIVDDGSGPAFEPALAAVRALGCEVLRHPVNKGKGVAIKTGLRYAETTFSGMDVVTADADGQHSADDIRRVSERSGRDLIILGVRRFDPMPLRSRFGNTVTQVLFRNATGRAVSDTQTGLRVYPAALLGRLGAVEGERFEYEMNVLLDAARTGQPMEEVVIPAVYLNGNAGSNFGGLSDSIRVYRPLLRFALASLMTRRQP
ncbi:glycosyltransferase involved in cell wall biosynthesis [Actinoplanes lutulentus]|uniref:Glycosyl transferase family 2 n=1 Tax=Actinoplanes lutulentus TaxID=1287878 RepID=A0A327ZC47_9ACTN|nr:glycosyltransferase family 2 protein [Actinoplanes lutulentus]MBB2947250.1 glycosyltransferase involved in cell wall biosynthesis [Actinoplanes lutulentus]RAK36525.1 glycosyl transferase family 2 [Actinoplanes lutulentus]